MQTIGSSGINEALSKELLFVTLTALFVVVANMLLVSYQDLSGVVHNGPLNFLDTNIKSLSLPALPFSIAMPALSLLLVFRTNTAYFRWNEARTLWGGLINNCRNIVRQTNTFFPDDPKHEVLKRRMAAEDVAFVKALRNFLRGPTDDETFAQRAVRAFRCRPHQPSAGRRLHGGEQPADVLPERHVRDASQG